MLMPTLGGDRLFETLAYGRGDSFGPYIFRNLIRRRNVSQTYRRCLSVRLIVGRNPPPGLLRTS